MLCVRCMDANKSNFPQMWKALNVSWIMPSKEIHFLLINKECHCLNPIRIWQALESTLQGILNIAESIHSFWCITLIADCSCYFCKLWSCDASWSRDWIAMAWHLRWIGKTLNGFQGMFDGINHKSSFNWDLTKLRPATVSESDVSRFMLLKYPV